MKLLKTLFLPLLLLIYLLGAFTGTSLGQELVWVLDKELEGLQEAEFETIYLEQGENPKALYFYLSPVKTDLGQEFPRKNIVIKTVYDSGLQTFHHEHDELLFLKQENNSSKVQVAILYSETVSAGIYQGSFYSGEEIEIPFQITVTPQLTLSLSTSEIKMDLNKGPGIYQLPESLEIKVTANYSNWSLKISSLGLYLEEATEDAEPIPLYFKPKTEFLGQDYGENALINLEITTELKWENEAGTYFGHILIEIDNLD